MKSAKRTPRVLFIAGLEPLANGMVGGQVTEAGTIFNAWNRSAIAVVPLQCSMPSSPPPPLYVRLGASLSKWARFLWALPRIDVVFVFLSERLNLVEKGLMCMVARGLGKGVVVRPSSGHVVRQCRTGWFWSWWLNLVMKSSDAICTQGTYWSEFFAEFPGASGKIVQVRNALVIPERAMVSKRAETHTQRVSLIAIVRREKGVFEAVEVFRRLSSRFPNLVLTIGGYGAAFTELQAHVQQLPESGRIELLGWQNRDQVYAILERTQVFLFPSWTEGMPNSVLEAMSFGVPCVTTRVGALGDVIEHGKTGFLAAVQDIEALTEHTSFLLANPAIAKEIGAAGRNRVELYRADRVWPIYEQLFQRVVAKENVEAQDTLGRAEATSNSNQ
jgi:glycosyltransferase involved in cell wall biosynthesis